MDKTFSQYLIAGDLLRGTRFHLGPVRLGFLLLLIVIGLGLMARSTIVVISQEDFSLPSQEQRAGNCLPNQRLASRPGTLQELLAHPDMIPSQEHSLMGKQAPDFELTDFEGNVWDRKELLNEGPVVLIFYYGYHCPSCVRQLREIDRDLPLFRELGTRVVAISADPPELTKQRFQQHGTFGFPVLSDPENKVAQAFRVFKGESEETNKDHLRHGTYILSQDGTVQWVNIGDAPFRRNSALLCQLAKTKGVLSSLPSPFLNDPSARP